MCTQESALYGDLVLYLRDRAAELLAGDGGDVGAEQERLDTIVRDQIPVRLYNAINR